MGCTALSGDGLRHSVGRLHLAVSLEHQGICSGGFAFRFFNLYLVTEIWVMPSEPQLYL